MQTNEIVIGLQCISPVRIQSASARKAASAVLTLEAFQNFDLLLACLPVHMQALSPTLVLKRGLVLSLRGTEAVASLEAEV